MQTITSKDTSIKVVNTVYKKCDFSLGDLILDYGGGKYDENIKYMKSKSKEVLVYDKYNRTEIYNQNTISKCKNNNVLHAVCSNVLNVINCDEEIITVLRNISSLVSDNATVYIQIYEGDKSGVSKVTSKGFQRNTRTKNYLEFIEKIQDYRVLDIKGNIIVCKIKHNN